MTLEWNQIKQHQNNITSDKVSSIIKRLSQSQKKKNMVSLFFSFSSQFTMRDNIASYKKILVYRIKSSRYCLCKFNFPNFVNSNGQNKVIWLHLLNTFEIFSLFEITLIKSDWNERYPMANKRNPIIKKWYQLL